MWIALSLIYAFSNAFYQNYNDKRRYNGYVLGIWRGFGVSLCAAPLLYFTPLKISGAYLYILTIQGILIGFYDSRVFFASAKYGGHSGSGFMATSVLITVLLWWAIEEPELEQLMQNPPYFISLILILCGYSASYWQMMNVKLNRSAEQYMYPAVFALALMSILTRYIAIHGKDMTSGIIYYLTVSCFISGIYNSLMYIKSNKPKNIRKPKLKDGIWLIILSMILIAAKTSAMRVCANPGYVVAMLLLSPIIAEVIKRRLKITPLLVLTLSFLLLLILLVS